jgi:hypothetical protein
VGPTGPKRPQPQAICPCRRDRPISAFALESPPLALVSLHRSFPVTPRTLCALDGGNQKMPLWRLFLQRFQNPSAISSSPYPWPWLAFLRPSLRRRERVRPLPSDNSIRPASLCILEVSSRLVRYGQPAPLRGRIRVAETLCLALETRRTPTIPNTVLHVHHRSLSATVIHLRDLKYRMVRPWVTLG